MLYLVLVLLLAAPVGWLLSPRLAVLPVAGAAALWLFLGGGSSATSGGPPIGGAVADYETVAAPQPAPRAQFRDGRGRRVSLADFRGRVVLLNLWATWCGPCRSEMPALDRLQARLAGDGFAVVAVSIEADGSDLVRGFFRQRDIRHLDTYIDADHALAMAVDAHAIPKTLIIDRDGNIVGSLVGAAAWDSAEGQALIRHYLDRRAGSSQG